MNYFISHPVGGDINHTCSQSIYQYMIVAMIVAEGMNDAFKQAQNDFNPLYQQFEVRSTCVGDIIQEVGSEDSYMVMSTGFRKVTQTVVGTITRQDLKREQKQVEYSIDDDDAAGEREFMRCEGLNRALSEDERCIYGL